MDYQLSRQVIQGEETDTFKEWGQVWLLSFDSDEEAIASAEEWAIANEGAAAELRRQDGLQTRIWANAG